jgi:D-glycero-alpha-D-manno-heptose-7-phosphate kinase
MIISKTPYRISFFGGGTDYPAWYHENGGAVLSGSIDKYCYINCRMFPRFFGYRYRIVWSHIENVSTIGEILHPAVREGLRYLGVNGDMCLEIHHQGDLPARAGMGSSSSFSVGLIKTILALKGQIIGKHELALKAIEFEQDVLSENVGSQDQMAASYGGLNIIRFETDGTIRVEPLTISKSRIAELESHLIMLYTGTSRLSSEIAGEIIDQVNKKEKVLGEMCEMVDEAVGILNDDKDISEFGHMLHRSWQLKRQLASQISNESIDRIYRTAMDNGAIGGKLLGAGASGFMVFFAPRECHQRIKDALPGYLYVPFKFEYEGSTLIHYSREEA